MTGDGPRLRDAKDRALASRIALRESADNLFGWLSPNRLKAEATIAATQQIDEAKAALRRSVTRHPLASWSVLSTVAVLLAYLLRRPAARLGRVGIDGIGQIRKKLAKRKKWS